MIVVMHGPLVFETVVFRVGEERRGVGHLFVGLRS